jgi:hypothetical protein
MQSNLTKIKENLALLENTTKELNNPQKWAAFLATSSRVYKYSFQDQVMIHAQKPQAVACAEYDVWSEVANRRVKYGSKELAQRLIWLSVLSWRCVVLRFVSQYSRRCACWGI